MIFKKIIILLILLFYSNSYSLDAFIFEKPCPLYEVNGENYKKIGILNEKQQYQFKNFKHIKKKNYAVIEDENHKELHVNKNCGYQKFEEKPKLEKIFSNEEIERLDSISPFDKEILNFCGYLGSHPTKEQFIAILSNEKYRKDFDYIYEKLNKKILLSSEKDEDKNEFLINLVNILFKTRGFVHSTCGFVRGEKLAGPHYHYRFLDLQKNEFIGQNNIKQCGEKNHNMKSIIKDYDIKFFDADKNFHAKCHNSFVKDFEVKDLIVIMGQIGRIKGENTLKSDKDKMKSFIHKISYNDQDISFKIDYNDEKKSLITVYPIEDK